MTEQEGLPDAGITSLDPESSVSTSMVIAFGRDDESTAT
jgi:hypothetical protein